MSEGIKFKWENTRGLIRSGGWHLHYCNPVSVFNKAGIGCLLQVEYITCVIAITDRLMWVQVNTVLPDS